MTLMEIARKNADLCIELAEKHRQHGGFGVNMAAACEGCAKQILAHAASLMLPTMVELPVREAEIDVIHMKPEAEE